VLRQVNLNCCHTLQEASTVKTFWGNLQLAALANPMWMLLENVDMGDDSEPESNLALVLQALREHGWDCGG
jgi:hypothetical protein